MNSFLLYQNIFVPIFEVFINITSFNNYVNKKSALEWGVDQFKVHAAKSLLKANRDISAFTVYFHKPKQE